MVGIFVIAILLVLMGVVFLRGKADGLIAGFNTASPEQKKKVDLKRLRLLVAIFHFVLAALFFLFLLKDSDLAATIFLSSVAVLAIVIIVLARTWTMKKTPRQE